MCVDGQMKQTRKSYQAAQWELWVSVCLNPKIWPLSSKSFTQSSTHCMLVQYKMANFFAIVAYLHNRWLGLHQFTKEISAVLGATSVCLLFEFFH